MNKKNQINKIRIFLSLGFVVGTYAVSSTDQSLEWRKFLRPLPLIEKIESCFSLESRLSQKIKMIHDNYELFRDFKSVSPLEESVERRSRPIRYNNFQLVLEIFDLFDQFKKLDENSEKSQYDYSKNETRYSLICEMENNHLSLISTKEIDSTDFYKKEVLNIDFIFNDQMITINYKGLIEYKEEGRHSIYTDRNSFEYTNKSTISSIANYLMKNVPRPIKFFRSFLPIK